MKSPIVFRSEFQQPKNSPMRIAARIGVELHHVAIGPPAEWRAPSCPGIGTVQDEAIDRDRTRAKRY